MKAALIPLSVLLLSGCSTSKIVCDQWRNKSISDERALAILNVQLFPEKHVAKNHVEMIHADGSTTKEDVTVTTSNGANVFFYCELIKEGMVDSTFVWTWGK